jgi:hypothetical protein
MTRLLVGYRVLSCSNLNNVHGLAFTNHKGVDIASSSDTSLAHDIVQQHSPMARAIGMIAQHNDTSTFAGCQYKHIPWIHSQQNIMESKIRVTESSTVNYQDLGGRDIV